MQFTRTGLIGAWGEGFVTNFLLRECNFVSNPYEGHRDIGIDLEVSVTEFDNITVSGGTIKLQVKTTEDNVAEQIGNGGYRFSLDDEHVSYWLGLHVVVIVVIVDYKSECAWWKALVDRDDYTGPRGGHSILFTTDDRLDASSKSVLKSYADLSNAVIAKSILSEAQGHLDAANALYDSFIDPGPLTQNHIDQIDSELKKTDWPLTEAKVLITYERRLNDIREDTISRYNTFVNQVELLRRSLVVGAVVYVDYKKKSYHDK